MSEHQLGLAAIGFILLWFWTLEESLNSLLAYVLRSIGVVCYQLLVMPHDNLVITIPEWIANFLVWTHWISLITVFLFPDPRFQKKRTT
jgi:hypothetical protein